MYLGLESMKHPWNLLDLVHLKGKCKFFFLMEDFPISLSYFIGGVGGIERMRKVRGCFGVKSFISH